MSHIAVHNFVITHPYTHIHFIRARHSLPSILATIYHAIYLRININCYLKDVPSFILSIY